MANVKITDLYDLTHTAANEYLSKFNWQKFMEECRIFEENVWKLDKERIMKKISSGNFKKSDLKLLE